LPRRVKCKGQAGARHVAWMRGAFNRQRLVAPGAGKPESKVSDNDATRANVAPRVATRPPNSRDLEPVGRGPVEPLQILASYMNFRWLCGGYATAL
jgi:hypothetical protein